MITDSIYKPHSGPSLRAHLTLMRQLRDQGMSYEGIAAHLGELGIRTRNNYRPEKPLIYYWLTYGDRTNPEWSVGSLNRGKTHCKRGHEFTPENTGNRPLSETHPNGGRYCKTCRLDSERWRRGKSDKSADWKQK